MVAASARVREAFGEIAKCQAMVTLRISEGMLKKSVSLFHPAILLIGNWINEGHTIGTAEIPSVPILTSDVYEWAPGGFFVVHSAFGKIGDTSVGGVEIIGVDGAAYASTLYDSFGNVHRSRLEIEGDLLRWTGDRTRCTVTLRKVA